MKEGWAKSIFTDVCKVINGRAYSKDEMLAEGKYRLLRVGNFFTNDSWYYSDLELEEDKYCEDGDLLYAWSASFGPRIWHGEKTIYHYHIWKLICTNKIDKHYLCYWLESETFKKQVMKSLHGATMMHVTKAIMEHTQVNYPIEISEQQQIVDFLDAEFAKIDELKNQAEQSLQNAKDLFQAALKEMLTPKEGWKAKSLEALSSITGNYGLSVSSRPYNGVRYLRITDITEWGELNEDMVSADIVEQTQEKLEDGDILFARTGATVGKTLIYKEEFGECLFAGYLIRYRLKKDEILPSFMFYFTHSSSYYQWVQINQKAAAQPNIGAKVYNGLEICYPPTIEEQEEIVTKLNTIFNNFKLLQSNYTRTIQLCADLKQALLRQVFE